MAVSSKHYEIHLNRKFYLYLSVLYCTEARARSTNCKEGFESLGSILVIMNTNTEIIVLPCGHQEVSPNYLPFIMFQTKSCTFRIKNDNLS